MTNLLKVTYCLFDAISFVFKNYMACLYRVLPVLFTVSILSWLLATFSPTLGIATGWVGKILISFCYAMFAVSWHRYSVLEEEQRIKGFSYRFGRREIKFGLLSVAFALFIQILLSSLEQFLQQDLALLLFALLMIPILITVFFIYPAIALDQPLQLRRYLNEGVKLIFSFIVAMVAIGIMILVLRWALMFGLAFLQNVFQPGALKMVLFVGYNLVAIPLFLAITTGTASFLYKDVIGLAEKEPTD
ncbi:MAG: hypothetical protein MI743_02310 [Sneathiellales bacterium]|nr:hypothetical protein [Sneathiellales bacterium]